MKKSIIHYSMKKIFVFGLVSVALIVGLSSCMKVEKSRPWKGDEEISADGGTVVWKPTIHLDDHIIPSIEVVYIHFYDSSDELVSHTEIAQQDVASQKVKGDGYEKFTGEWFEAVTSTNAVSITLTPNNTPFKRGISVYIGDGPYMGIGFHEIIASQLPKSWNQESE